MATIYRFIVEEGTKGSKGAGGRKSTQPSKKKTGKGKWVSVFGGGNKGGVEANRKTRAINPLLNRATGGYWEKATRVGRAGLGLVKRNTETGALALSGSAVAIIVAMIIQIVLKHHDRLIKRMEQENKQNYKRMETGQSSVHGNYEVYMNCWSGKISYNENK